MAEQPRAVVFGSAIEGLHRRFGARLPPALIQELRVAGMDIENPQAAYTLALWLQTLGRVLPVLYPGIDENAASEQMGREFIFGFSETVLGRALLHVARLLGPRRMLERMNRNFKQMGNYADSKLTVVGPTEATLETWMSSEFLWEWRGSASVLAHHRAGVIKGGLELIGTQGVVELIESDLETQRFTYRVRWS